MSNNREYDWKLDIETYIGEVLPNLVLRQDTQAMCKHRWESRKILGMGEGITYTLKNCQVCGLRILKERKK